MKLTRTARHGTAALAQALVALRRRAGGSPRRLLALLLSALICLAGPLGNATTAYAGAAVRGQVPITKVSESTAEPKGYSTDFLYTGSQIESGFSEHRQIGRYAYWSKRWSEADWDAGGRQWIDYYMHSVDKPGSPATSAGYAFFIDSGTTGEASVRFTGARYGSDKIDAVVTVKDYTYIEPVGGWDAYKSWLDTSEMAPIEFRTGIYMCPGYVVGENEADYENGLINNFNFYSVGIDRFTVEVKYVLAGTNTPAEVKGHLTCMDLDCNQSFSFGGSINQGRIIQDNDCITLHDNGTRAVGFNPADWTGALNDSWKNNPEEYKKGLVSTYFNTFANEDGGSYGTPAVFNFGTSWNGTFDGSTPESFFSLSNEFLTMPLDPPGDTISPTKTADKTSGVSVGDEVTYTVEATMHEEGVNCRGGYKYSNYDILDFLPAEMRYVDGSGYLVDESGNKVDAGSVIYEGEQEDPTQNVVRYEFDSKFLKSMPMKGQKYRFIFKAVLTEYPANGQRDLDGDLYVENSASVRINNEGDIPTNTVITKLVEPKFDVDKEADAYEYEVGDIISYTVTYRQTEKNAQSRETVISDNLPEYLELVASSVHATGIKDLPAPSIEGNKWSYSFDKFNYGDTITVTYQAKALNSGNGREIVNNADIHAINAMDADDPAEVYTNTADVCVTKDVDRYEGYVGASDQDPGFFEYTVKAWNAKEGTVANNVVITDDTLPEHMLVGRTNEGNLMVEVTADDGSATTGNMRWDGSEATGSFADFPYREGREDDIHDQTRTQSVSWKLVPQGTGWKLTVDHLNHGVNVTVRYRAYPEDKVSGWEIENKATIGADNSLPDEDTAKVWVNQPHLKVVKTAAQDKLTVGDTILYHIDVTNETPGTLGRDLVVSDLAHTKGVHLLRESIRVYDSEGKDITDGCTVTTRHGDENTFIIETHRNIVSTADEYPYWEFGEQKTASGKNPLKAGGETKVSVEYQVYIADADLAGKTVDNTAQAVTDEPNTNTTDDEVVNVKGAKLTVDKSSDKDVYVAGETGHYTLKATQTREDVVAKNVVVEDRMDEPYAGSIVEGSVRATGPDGKAIAAEPEYVRTDDGKAVGFRLATGIDLADEESVDVTYDVSMEKAGSDLSNKVQATADDALSAVDVNEVTIVGPRTTMEFDKAVDAHERRVGEWATYTLTAKAADHDAQNVVVSDNSLPEGMPIDLRGVVLKVNGKEISTGTVDYDGNGFTAHFGDLLVGDVATVTYRAQVRDEKLMGTSVVNTAWAKADNLDEPLRDDEYVTVLEDAPDISFDKSADRQTAKLGETVTYTLSAKVADDAERPAGNVVVSDKSMPAGMPIDMASIRAWLNGREIKPVNADIDGNTFSIAFGTLKPGEDVKVTYAAQAVDEGLEGTDVTNTAKLQTDLLEEPLTDDETVRIGEPEDPGPGEPEDPADPDTPGEEADEEDVPALEKSVDDATPAPGQTVRYEVKVVVGEHDLADAVVTDAPDAGIAIDPASFKATVAGNELAGATAEEGEDGTVTFRLGALAKGTEVLISYDAVVDEEGAHLGKRLLNTATLTARGIDPVSDEEELTPTDPDAPKGEADPGADPGTKGGTVTGGGSQGGGSAPRTNLPGTGDGFEAAAVALVAAAGVTCLATGARVLYRSRRGRHSRP